MKKEKTAVAAGKVKQESLLRHVKKNWRLYAFLGYYSRLIENEDANRPEM